MSVCLLVLPGRCSACPRPGPTAHTSGWTCSPPGWSAASGRPASGRRDTCKHKTDMKGFGKGLRQPQRNPAVEPIHNYFMISRQALQQAASPHINSAQTLTVPLGGIRSAGKATPAIIIQKKQKNTCTGRDTLLVQKEVFKTEPMHKCRRPSS